MHGHLLHAVALTVLLAALPNATGQCPNAEADGCWELAPGSWQNRAVQAVHVRAPKILI
jgi:hypothetical protein